MGNFTFLLGYLRCGTFTRAPDVVCVCTVCMQIWWRCRGTRRRPSSTGESPRTETPVCFTTAERTAISTNNELSASWRTNLLTMYRGLSVCVFGVLTRSFLIRILGLPDLPYFTGDPVFQPRSPASRKEAARETESPAFDYRLIQIGRMTALDYFYILILIMIHCFDFQM